jgi:uncharacterized damage-inducible protein DinB
MSDEALSDRDEHGRIEPDPAADEATTLLGFLDYHRATFAWKTRGLDAAGLTATVGASAMTLAGLTKHLALVEDDWLSRILLGREWSEPWASVDWSEDPDWEWRTALTDDPVALRELWTGSVERSRVHTATALAAGGLDEPAARAWADGRAPSLRWILVHLIEEYARHNGHADLLREAVDGETGE